VLPSVIVGRFFDGVWLALGVGLTAIFLPLPGAVLEAGDVLAAVLLVGIAVLAFVILRRGAAQERASAGRGQEGAVRSLVRQLAIALHDQGRSKEFYLAFFCSPGVPGLQALALWAVMLAYRLPLAWWGGVIVLLIIHMGTAIPNAPANIGSYQFFCVVGLTLLGVDKNVAAGFSVVAFVVLTVPLWLLGAMALSLAGTSLAAIRRDVLP
jgi:uncharacterized membrane protein YbhN (UPF0104 family)